MDFLKVQTSIMDDPRFALADSPARAGWLAALLFAGRTECGGRIAGAQAWGGRQTLVMLKTDRADIDAAVSAGLLSWSPAGELVVEVGFDLAAEQKVQGLRANGSRGGRPAAAEPLRLVNQGPPNGVTISAPLVNQTGNQEPENGSTDEDQDEIKIETTTTAAPVNPVGVSKPEAPPKPVAMRLDRSALNAALAAKDVSALAGVFGCQVDCRAHEWNAATEGLSVQTCLAILGWRRLEGDSIRQPSGFIQARAEWRELSEADRIAVGELVSEATGVALRAKRAA